MDHATARIEETNKTPLVVFDYSAETITISGKIIPENPLEFFDQLDALLQKYISLEKSSVTLNIYLDYFNSVSSKSFLKFLRTVISIKQNDTEVTINWYYQKDDVELKDAGDDYAFILQFPFNILETSEK